MGDIAVSESIFKKFDDVISELGRMCQNPFHPS